jgi:hypothetical protein
LTLIAKAIELRRGNLFPVKSLKDNQYLLNSFNACDLIDYAHS